MAPKKATSTATKKSTSSHPAYKDMIKDAIITLKDRSGSSRQAIKKYVRANNDLGNTTDASFDKHIASALNNGEKAGEFERPKGPSGPVKLARKDAASKTSTSAKPKIEKKPTTKTTTTTKSASKPSTTTKKTSTTKKASSTTTKKTSSKPKTTAKTTTIKKTVTAPAVQDKPTVLTKTKSGRVAKTKAQPSTTKKTTTKKTTTKKATPKKVADKATA